MATKCSKDFLMKKYGMHASAKREGWMVPDDGGLHQGCAILL